MLGVVLLSVGLVALQADSGEAANWALLVAGSNGFYNYRHQADICHAYQILKDRGFPEDNIITLMYDDIASSPENPLPGQLINRPGGPDVYKGVVIDYKGEDVNPKNFLNILSGNAEAMKNIGSGKVINSGPEDVVFVNFADHGGPGILCFPSDDLYADDLEKTLSGMAKKNQFKKLLFYVEACEAGSMFDNILEENNKILVSTASARDESSYGWYCDSEPVNTCLGDLFSITWMEHMDQIAGSPSANEEKVFHQYDYVRTQVNKSHVNIYGDFSIGFDSLQEYFGKSSGVSNLQNSFYQNGKVSRKTYISSRDVPLHTAKQQFLKAPEHMKAQRAVELKRLFKNRLTGDKIFSDIVSAAANGDSNLIEDITNQKYQLNKKIFPCYKFLVETFNKECFNTAKHYYLLRHLYKLVNMCSIPEISIQDATYAIRNNCHSNGNTDFIV